MEDLKGDHLIEALSASVRCLEECRDYINSLNVFPVPDGDTGTNMLLTLRAGMERCGSAARPGEAPGAGQVAAAMAQGTFWGARGNSGVILSQFFQGLAQALEGKATCDAADLALGFRLASESAYQAVGQPVEGTMLTVIRAASEAVQVRAQQGETSPPSLWEAAFQAAAQALERTPEQLPVLRQAGVVDAGGMGMVAALGGIWGSLSGRVVDLARSGRAAAGPAPAAYPAMSAAFLHTVQGCDWGYCTQFIIQGQDLSPETIRQWLAGDAGDSAVVAGDESQVRVHVHLHDPGPAISYGASLGELSQVSIQNMNEQGREFASGGTPAAPPVEEVAVVAVSPGQGFTRLFRESGCAGVVAGGQTMNPSISELFEAGAATGAGDVILLPNNGNVVLAAEQAARHHATDQRVHVVPSRTLPQGVAAALAFNPVESLQHNLEAMRSAIGQVVTIEVARAVRAVTVSGRDVRCGEYMALCEGEVTLTAENPDAALEAALAATGVEPEAIITLYWGEDVAPEQAERLQERLRSLAADVQVDLVYGGQPHYPYIASVE